MNTQVPIRVHVALLIAQAAFAGFAVVGKGVLETVPPLAIAAMRILGATPLLLGGAWLIDRTLPSRRDLPMLAALGLLGVFGNQLLFILGLERTTATNASILMPSIPVFAVLVGSLFGTETLHRKGWFGVLLAVAGALVMLDPTRFAAGDGAAVGNLLVLINCLSYGAYLVLQRPILRRLPPLTVTAWAFVFGGLGVLSCSWNDLAAFPMSELSLPLWIGIGYIVIIPTVVGHAIMSYGVSRSSPSLVATYTTMQPLFTAFLAAWFLSESIGVKEVIGFVLIVVGLRWVSTRRSQ